MGLEVLEQVWQVSKGVLVHLAKVLFTWHSPFVHLPNLIKEIIERVFTLGNWCFGLLCTTCQHTIWTWIACNHWTHHKPFIDVNPNPNHKPACPCHSSKSCMGVIHGAHFPHIQAMKTRSKDHLNVNCSGFFFKPIPDLLLTSCYERRSLLTFEQSLKDGSPFFNQSRET